MVIKYQKKLNELAFLNGHESNFRTFGLSENFVRYFFKKFPKIVKAMIISNYCEQAA